MDEEEVVPWYQFWKENYYDDNLNSELVAFDVVAINVGKLVLLSLFWIICGAFIYEIIAIPWKLVGPSTWKRQMTKKHEACCRNATDKIKHVNLTVMKYQRDQEFIRTAILNDANINAASVLTS